jgi:hypothetical protein
MPSLDPRLPVLVGLGAADNAAPVVDLMTDAVSAATADAGAPGLLRRIDCIAVPQGTWSLTDLSHGASGRRTRARCSARSASPNRR